MTSFLARALLAAARRISLSIYRPAMGSLCTMSWMSQSAGSPVCGCSVLTGGVDFGLDEISRTSCCSLSLNIPPSHSITSANPAASGQAKKGFHEHKGI